LVPQYRSGWLDCVANFLQCGQIVAQHRASEAGSTPVRANCKAQPDDPPGSSGRVKEDWDVSLCGRLSRMVVQMKSHSPARFGTSGAQKTRSLGEAIMVVRLFWGFVVPALGVISEPNKNMNY
jgi:hypothetical protein